MTTTKAPHNFLLIFRNQSRPTTGSFSATYTTAEEAIETARWNVNNAREVAPNVLTHWIVIRISDVVTLAEDGRTMPVASPVWYLIRCFDRANQYLANVITHPENWHDHQLAIEDAKELVFDAADAIAEYQTYA